jgi:phytoene/squalene synthetase
MTSETADSVFLPPDFQHPTLLLLRDLRTRYKLPWNKSHFDNVLLGRRQDLDLKQYETLHDMHQQAEISCGSLIHLVLESAHFTNATNPKAHEAARLVGVAHGLTNALRKSIPILSTTGKLVIPAELTEKYDIQSPRYLLSALAMGDEECHAKLQKAVAEICNSANNHLMQARALQNDVLTGEKNEGNRNGRLATHILLPGIASETFLQRLYEHRYDLTHRQLRHVGVLEHAKCAGRILKSYLQSTY